MANRKSFNEYYICGNIAKIILHNKKGQKIETIIDTKNLKKLIKFNRHWHLEWNKYTKSYYVKTTIYIGIINGNPKSETLRLHNFLLNKKTYARIDHINHDTLDNRMCNIREVGVDNNATNRQGLNSNNTSGYRNVSWINDYWRIQLQINGRNHLFSEKFDDVEKAGIFAEKMRNKYYGKFV